MTDRGDIDDDDAPVPEVRRVLERMRHRPQRDHDALAAQVERAAELLAEPLPTIH